MQDGFASQEPEEGSALHLIAESGENRLFPAEEGSEETGTDHENGQEIRKVSGQGHQKETAEAGSHPCIEARGGQMLRTEPEISSGVGSSRPYHRDPVRMPTSEHTLIRDTAEMLVSRAPLKEGVLELELEPVSLGKLTIRVAFESGRTAVTVLSSSSETLEILSRSWKNGRENRPSFIRLRPQIREVSRHQNSMGAGGTVRMNGSTKRNRESPLHSSCGLDSSRDSL